MARECDCCGASLGPNEVACSYCGTAVPKEESADMNQQFYQTSNGGTQVIQNIYVTNNSGSSANFGGMNLGNQLNVEHLENIARGMQSSKNKYVAAILAFFFGFCGAQFFYLKKTGLGILFIFMMSTGIPAIVGFIHGVMLIKMSDAEFAAKYP